MPISGPWKKCPSPWWLDTRHERVKCIPHIDRLRSPWRWGFFSKTCRRLGLTAPLQGDHMIEPYSTSLLVIGLMWLKSSYPCVSMFCCLCSNVVLGCFILASLYTAIWSRCLVGITMNWQPWKPGSNQFCSPWFNPCPKMRSTPMSIFCCQRVQSQGSWMNLQQNTAKVQSRFIKSHSEFQQKFIHRLILLKFTPNHVQRTPDLEASQFIGSLGYLGTYPGDGEKMCLLIILVGRKYHDEIWWISFDSSLSRCLDDETWCLESTALASKSGCWTK